MWSITLLILKLTKQIFKNYVLVSPTYIYTDILFCILLTLVLLFLTGAQHSWLLSQPDALIIPGPTTKKRCLSRLSLFLLANDKAIWMVLVFLCAATKIQGRLRDKWNAIYHWLSGYLMEYMVDDILRLVVVLFLKIKWKANKNKEDFKKI